MNRSEEKQLVKLLNQCTPGALSSTVFNAIAKVCVQPAVEFVPLRKKDGHIEVLLIKRDDDDDICWPGMFHTPGTILRPTDTTFCDAFVRLSRDELGVDTVPHLTFVGHEIGQGKRGTGVTFEYIVHLDQDHYGNFYLTEALPDNFIEEQRPLLQRCIEKFQGL